MDEFAGEKLTYGSDTETGTTYCLGCTATHTSHSACGRGARVPATSRSAPRFARRAQPDHQGPALRPQRYRVSCGVVCTRQHADERKEICVCGRSALLFHCNSVLYLSYPRATTACTVFVVRTEPHYARPWQMRTQRASTGSGFVTDTEKRLIMTNAHVVRLCLFYLARWLRVTWLLSTVTGGLGNNDPCAATGQPQKVESYLAVHREGACQWCRLRNRHVPSLRIPTACHYCLSLLVTTAYHASRSHVTWRCSRWRMKSSGQPISCPSPWSMSPTCRTQSAWQATPQGATRCPSPAASSAA